MAMNSEYRGSASNVAKKKTTTRKTVVTPGTKVSQATINKIKAMGMKKALAGAASASPEMREGLKRLYGANRVAAAKSSGPKYTSPDAARAGAGAKKSSGPVYKSADAARAAASKPAKGTAKSADAARAAAMNKSNANVPYKSGFKTTNLPSTPSTRANSKVVTLPKKTGTTDPFAKFVFGLGKSLKGGSNNGMTAAQVAAENKRRAALAKKNK